MSEYHDKDLIADFRKGTKRAFEEIFEKFFESIYFLSHSLVQNEDQAKDISIQALTTLMKMHKNFDSIANIRAFLNIAARNASLNAIRAAKRSEKNKQGLEQSMKGSKDYINDEIDLIFIRKIYNSSLENLPPQTRKVIRLLYEEELPYQEVADRLSISIFTVKNLRAFAIKKMRTALHSQGLMQDVLELMTCVAMLTVYCFDAMK